MIEAAKIQIEQKQIDELIPYVNNARTHSDEQVAEIAASIRAFGFTNPILIDGESGIIAGHGRLLAARKLGMDEVPCIELSHLTDVQKRAYIIADNKLAMNADWDMEILSLEMVGLKDLGFNLELVGFDDDEIADIFGDDKVSDDYSGISGDDERFLLLVELQTEEDQYRLHSKLTAQGHEVKVMS